MGIKHQIQIFVPGTAICEATLDLARNSTCNSCEVTLLGIEQTEVAQQARQLGVNSMPAVVINGKHVGDSELHSPRLRNLVAQLRERM